MLSELGNAIRKRSRYAAYERRGDGESPPGVQAAGRFRAARDDRDGRSRYRAAKISEFLR